MSPQPPALSDAGRRFLRVGRRFHAPDQIAILETGRLEPRPLEVYAPPRGFERVVGEEGVALLQEAIATCHHLDLERGGQPLIDAILELSAEPALLDLEERLETWLELHLDARVHQLRHLCSGPADLLGAGRLGKRLFEELSPWVNQVFSYPWSLTRLVGGALPGQLQWGILRRALHPSVDLLGWDETDGDWTAFCGEITRARDHQRLWCEDLDLHLVACPEPLPAVSRVFALKQLRRFAGELATYKPVLVGHFPPASQVVQLDGGLWACWCWWGMGHLGMVGLGPDAASLLESLEVSPEEPGVGEDPEGVRWYQVDARGRFQIPGQSWITTETVDPELLAGLPHAAAPGAAPADRILRLNLLALREVLNQQEQLYQRRLACLLDPSEDADRTEEEAILAGVARAQRPAGRDRTLSGSQLRGLRLNPFLRLMEDHFGITARQGQGSELVLQRPGHRLTYTLGRHKKNGVVGPYHLYRLLRCFDISAEDWLAATG